MGYVELAGAQSVLVMRMGRHAEAIELAERALPAAEARGMLEATIELLITRGVSLASVGRPIEAVAALTGALAEAERHGLAGAVLRAAINLSYAFEPEDPAAGFRIARDGMEKARALGPALGPALPDRQRVRLGHRRRATGTGRWLRSARSRTSEVDPTERLFFGAVEATIRASRGEPVDELVVGARGHRRDV